MSHRGKVQHVLDIDFSFLDVLPVADWFPALLQLCHRHRATWYDLARVIESADNPTFLQDVQRKALEENSPTTLTMIPKDLAEFKSWLWETMLPQYIRSDRRRLSDYRVALNTLRRYAKELDAVTFDPDQDGAFTKLLTLPRAIKTHGPSPEVFMAIVKLDTRAFATYAKSGRMPALDSSPLKEYLDVLNRRYH